MTNIWYGTSGSRTPRLLIVGEAWGAEEAKTQLPFVGQSGRELFRMLGEALKLDLPLLNQALAARSQSQWLSMRQAWLEKNHILLANTIAAHPPGNDYRHFLYSNQEAKHGKHPSFYGIYPKPQLSSALSNLHNLIATTNPDLIIATGNWALHALTDHAEPKTDKGYKLPTGISNWRGSQTWCDNERLRRARAAMPCASVTTSDGVVVPERRIPLLPILHPAALLRDWSYRHVTVHDIRARAGRFLAGQRSWEAPLTNDIWKPDFTQVLSALHAWRNRLDIGALWLSVDIETYAKKHITCVGLCDGGLALCIPMFSFNERQQAVDYWKPEQEQTIWLLIKSISEHPNIRIIGQNFIYDTQYLARNYSINAIVSGDTMIGHHVMYPGTDKDLSTLASLYNDHYCFWKHESEEWAADELSAEDLWRYNCKDTRSTFEAWTVIWRSIEQQQLQSLYYDKLEQWELSRHITLNGCNQDAQLKQKFNQELYWEVNREETVLLSMVPEAYRYTAAQKPWFTSSQKTAFILYQVLGLTPILHKKTKQPTTDDTAIQELCDREDTQWLAPLLLRLRDYRSAMVIKRNFLDAKPMPNGRWGVQVNVSHPETHRWSTGKNAFDEGSNMQNLPRMED